MVTPDRLAIGQRRRADVAAFPDIETRFGVPRDVLLGVWALESGFGSIQGDYDTLRSLATLAAQGRRRDWAEGEIIATLKIIQSGVKQPRSRLRGSWAGAMGQTQFIPSTYLSTAVDEDGDGRRARHLDLQRRRPGLGREPAGKGGLGSRAEPGARGRRSRRLRLQPHRRPAGDARAGGPSGV